MPDNMGKDLATSDPFMQIGLTIAKVGKMVQDGEVPQSVKDAYEALKAHASSGSAEVQKAYETVKKHISDMVSQPVKGEELLTQKQGPELPLAGTSPTPSSTKSSQPGTISQKDFADGLRAKIPALKDFTDSQIVNKILQLRPDLEDKIESPIMGDQIAGKAQDRLQNEADNNSTKQFLRAITSSLPGIGMIGGGLLAAPETFGAGAVLGGGLGAGAGRGAQDYIDGILGLTQTNNTQKTQNIVNDSLLAAFTPGVMESLKTPVDSLKSTVKGTAGMLSDFKNSVIPPKLRGWLVPDFLEKIAKSGSSEVDPLVRPPNVYVQPNAGIQPEKSVLDRLEEMMSKGQTTPRGPGISQSAEDLLKSGKGELPKFRVNGDGTFTNMSTGEVLDKSGKPVSTALTVQDKLAKILKNPEILNPDQYTKMGDINSPTFGNIKRVTPLEADPEWRQEIKALWGNMSDKEINRYNELKSIMSGPISKITPEMHDEFLALQAKRPGPSGPDQYLMKLQAEQQRLKNIESSKSSQTPKGLSNITRILGPYISE